LNRKKISAKSSRAKPWPGGNVKESPKMEGAGRNSRAGRGFKKSGLQPLFFQNITTLPGLKQDAF
jgi:hypothetical protein